MTPNRVPHMNRGTQWMLGLALAAGSFASACTPAETSDEQPEVSQSQAALRTVGAATIATSPATATTTTVTATTVTATKLPVLSAPPLVFAPVTPPPAPAHAVCGKTVRISSAQLDQALIDLLAGTRIAYDTTDTSDPLLGPFYKCVYPNQEARDQGQADCLAGPPQDKGTCLEQLNEEYPNIKECHWAIFAYHSYVDFSATAEDHGAEDLFFDVDTIVRDTWAGRVDVDITNVNTTVSAGTLISGFSKDPASDQARANLSLKLSSGSPTVKLEHFTGPYAVNLTNMFVDAQLTAIGPTADKTQLGFGEPLVTFRFDKDVLGIPDWVVAIFKDVESLIRGRVENTLESALGKDETRGAINQALTGLAEHFAHQKIRIFHGAWFDGGDLVVDYSPDTGLASSFDDCTHVAAP